jgi:molybdopterin synthase catalytic subunit
MDTPLLRITPEPLAIEPLMAAVERLARTDTDGCGAICSFVGVVRSTHRGRRVDHLEYEAFDALALKVFGQIAAEIQARWPGARVGIHHRVGRLAIGEASVAIAAATAHRAESFAACRYAIERIKQVAPIWKHEFLEDGDVWIEGAVADPADEAARQQAIERACG